ncbi:MAG: phage tail protein [Bryobacteraceae bacterium]|nr:phage tail protein [Bryobacteraceae bacterium]
MSLIDVLKSQEATETPLLLFECILRNGLVERWCTHRVRVEGHEYEPRVLRHSGFEMRLGAEDGLDHGARMAVTLANTDGRISQLDATIGWRGARLRVRFGFFDLESGEPVSELAAVFMGIANPAEELTEREARLSFLNRLSLQRLQVPSIRIQSRCPWRFPETREEREEAVAGGSAGRYSSFFRCGYSADVEGGRGNLNGGEPYESCGFTREDCRARGMFDADDRGRKTARFGGFAFLPASVLVRPHGARESQWSDPVDGRGRPNDAVPLVYGTAWIQAPVIFARNDGNLTHCEVLLGLGPIEGVRKVIANGVEIPMADDRKDMSGTGWYSVLTVGERDGGFNAGFTDAEGRPQGDPHGSMACLSVVLPNQIVERGRLPRVEVLLDGLKLPRYSESGQLVDVVFTRNPAWVLLDLLRMSGWTKEEIDFGSFWRTAQYCDEFIPQRAPGGEQLLGPRFEVNLALTRRKSLSEVVRGIRTAAALLITLDAEGRVSLRPETTLAREAPTKRPSSNATGPILGGWPAYEFGDGSGGISGILRRHGRDSTFRLFRRSSAEVPNRLIAEFADSFRDYAPDTLALTDYRDAQLQGCEVTAPLGALGLPHFDQAARILRLNLEKNTAGNQFIEFETTMQAFGLRPGDVIAITHRREGLERALFRVLKIVAGLNFETVRLVAQRHEDRWYEAAAEGDAGDYRDSSWSAGIPRSLAGRRIHPDGREEFDAEVRGGGEEAPIEVAVRFTPPARPATGAPRPPSVSLAARVRSGEGNLVGGRTLYYAVTCSDELGRESPPSFVIEARLPGAATGYAVELSGIRCSKDASAVTIYRGESPSLLRRIGTGSASALTFVDNGLPAEPVPPPDPNYDHARFQWRFELLPETEADQFGATVIGNSGLGLLPDEYRGCAVRIVSGKGAGQERIIEGHNATELRVSPAWRVPPDQSSRFVVAESGWRPAGTTRSGEIRFLVPQGSAGTVQFLGLAVSGRGAESPESDALLGRVELTDTAAGDSDVPPKPDFGIAAAGEGGFLVSGIGFPTLQNTRTIRTGTLTVHYWNELESPSPWHLAADLPAEESVIFVNPALGAGPGDLLQIGRELLRILEVRNAGAELLVERGVHDTPTATHSGGEAIFPLKRLVAVFPFQKGFFGSPASGSYNQRVDLPWARIAAAEFYVTNQRGSSPTAFEAYTSTAEAGLRTMSGGQYTIQYDGPLAVMSSVAPPLIVERLRAVRDIQAHVDQPPVGEPVQVRVLVDGVAYADLVIPPGAHASEVVSCFGRPPLAEGALLHVAIVSVGTAVGSYPGRGLTVTIRL